MGNRAQENVADAIVKNRLRDIVNQMIIVGSVENDYSYFKSKNGTTVKIENAGKSNQMIVKGGWQLENNAIAKVDSIYDMSTTGNGKSYRFNEQFPMAATRSVYQILNEKEEYSEFLKLLSGSENLPADDHLLLSTITLNNVKYNCVNSATNSNIRLFGAYNYTVYVPTNESIRKLINDGVLPTWEDYDAQYEISEHGSTEEERAAAKAACTMISNRILDFVKYHIQDNSVAVNGAPDTDSEGIAITKNNYESMMLNTETNRFYSLEVDMANKSLTVKDLLGDTRSVVKKDGLYNNICREYWISGSLFNKSIYTTADVLVHQIDGPLFYTSSQKTPWRQEMAKSKARRR